VRAGVAFDKRVFLAQIDAEGCARDVQRPQPFPLEANLAVGGDPVALPLRAPARRPGAIVGPAQQSERGLHRASPNDAVDEAEHVPLASCLDH